LKNFPVHKTVEFLVSVGADLYARDVDGNTPLHTAVESKPDCSELVQTLLSSGAHLDETNNRKQTFDDILKRTHTSHSAIDRMQYTSLKCLAARVVSREKIPYRGVVPASLEAFLEVH